MSRTIIRNVEREITERAIQALLAAGYRLSVDYGDGESEPWSEDASAILTTLMNVDDAYLKVARNGTPPDRHEGWVRFVYGNDGWDTISDYTTNLEAALKTVNDYADSLS